MILTPEEARKKWCSSAINSANPEESTAGNRYTRYEQDPKTKKVSKVGHVVEPSCLCIADDCMSWRWIDSNKDYGYCGKAGIPLDALVDRIHDLFRGLVNNG